MSWNDFVKYQDQTSPPTVMTVPSTSALWHWACCSQPNTRLHNPLPPLNPDIARCWCWILYELAKQVFLDMDWLYQDFILQCHSSLRRGRCNLMQLLPKHRLSSLCLCGGAQPHWVLRRDWQYHDAVPAHFKIPSPRFLNIKKNHFYIVTLLLHFYPFLFTFRNIFWGVFPQVW